jgi:hypothetical protein
MQQHSPNNSGDQQMSSRGPSSSSRTSASMSDVTKTAENRTQRRRRGWTKRSHILSCTEYHEPMLNINKVIKTHDFLAVFLWIARYRNHNIIPRRWRHNRCCQTSSQRHEYIIQMTLWSINSNIAECYSWDLHWPSSESPQKSSVCHACHPGIIFNPSSSKGKLRWFPLKYEFSGYTEPTPIAYQRNHPFESLCLDYIQDIYAHLRK